MWWRIIIYNVLILDKLLMSTCPHGLNFTPQVLNLDTITLSARYIKCQVQVIWHKLILLILYNLIYSFRLTNHLLDYKNLIVLFSKIIHKTELSVFANYTQNRTLCICKIYYYKSIVISSTKYLKLVLFLSKSIHKTELFVFAKYIITYQQLSHPQIQLFCSIKLYTKQNSLYLQNIFLHINSYLIYKIFKIQLFCLAKLFIEQNSLLLSPKYYENNPQNNINAPKISKFIKRPSTLSND